MTDWVAPLSGVAAVASVAISFLLAHYSRAVARAALDQANAATGANQFAIRAGQSEAVLHFTGRFFDLMRDGAKFGNTNWEYQFWSLHATEFYFFDNSWIPEFVYRIWMADLTSMYHSAQIRESHATYLQRYSGSYGRMCEFFGDLQKIPQQSSNDAALQNGKIAEVVNKWTKGI